MGSITGFSDESPVHEVTLTNDLYVFRNEVTNLLWYHIMDTLVTPTKLREYPKDSISWQESILFANRLSMIYGFEPAYTINNDLVEYNMESNGWRLPTEAEWEFICKGNSEEDFSGTGDINEMGYYDSNSGLNKHKVGEKKANENGLYDVHGNLWEWCWNFYSETYYSTMSQVDPLGPSNGIRHVLRGGSFQDGFNYARSTNRSIKKLDLNAIGLRLVRNAK
jgi:formylglycine-generating enzyme required for sulfatase activity